MRITANLRASTVSGNRKVCKDYKDKRKGTILKFKNKKTARIIFDDFFEIDNFNPVLNDQSKRLIMVDAGKLRP